MKVLSGKSLNALTVSGQAFKFERKITTVSCIHTPSAEDEAGRFAAAQQTALEQLHELRDTAVSKVGKQLAKIFDIHMVPSTSTPNTQYRLHPTTFRKSSPQWMTII